MLFVKDIDWPDSPELHALMGALLECWPAPMTLTSENVGLDGRQDSNQNFLRTVQALSDAGLLQYEALLVGATRGPEVVDALLTARGRAAFGLRAGG